MEYLRLTLGIVSLIAFVFILLKNSKRKGLLHALIRVDSIAGVVIGLYLVTTSILDILG